MKKIQNNINSHNYNKSNKSENKFISPQDNQLEYLKMKLMNKKKFELKQMSNNLNFTNPMNHIGHNESSNLIGNTSNNTNSNANLNTTQKNPINYQIFLKNPSDKEKQKTTSNSVYSISNVNNSSNSNLKLSLTK